MEVKLTQQSRVPAKSKGEELPLLSGGGRKGSKSLMPLQFHWLVQLNTSMQEYFSLPVSVQTCGCHCQKIHALARLVMPMNIGDANDNTFRPKYLSMHLLRLHDHF